MNVRSGLLAESASGLRHLRWAREIHATLEGHAEMHGTPDERHAWTDEARRLGAAIDAFREVVKAYRDFLERVRVKRRGALRAATCLDAPEVRRKAQRDYDELEARERRPRKLAVRRGVLALRGSIALLLDRCEAAFGAAFATSLLPAVTADGQFVVDDEDEDDDATLPVG